jgi:hypothetical protein
MPALERATRLVYANWMKRTPILTALLLSSLCACATSGPTAMVEIPNAPRPAATPGKIDPTKVFVSKSEPPFACKQLGGINLVMDRGYDGNIAAMRQEVAEGGGNYLVIDGNMMGRSYSCPMPCTPACSPGFTCVDSTCVSACNPPCKSGERCGDDRTCHHIQPVGTET